MRKTWALVTLLALGGVALLTSCSNVTLSASSAGQPSAAGLSILYVATPYQGVPSQQRRITGYQLAADGTLKAVPCATVTGADVVDLVGSGPLLLTTDGDRISVYSVDQSGCLTFKSVTDEDLSTDSGDCWSICSPGGPGTLFLDPKGHNFYSWNYLSVNGSTFVSYSLDPLTWAITRTGTADTGERPMSNALLAFSPDGAHAVSATLNSYSTPTSIFVYERSSGGTLRFLNSAPMPAMESGEGFSPDGAAADSANHYIVAGEAAYSWSLAIYTMESSGNMTTHSTSQNMQIPPSVQDQELIGYAFSPDGRYFAIGSANGIDVYTWNTTSAALAFLASIPRTQPCAPHSQVPCSFFHDFAWDHYDHIIAAYGFWSDPSAQIQVYSVSASGLVPAPGSPYPLSSANRLTIVDTDR